MKLSQAYYIALNLKNQYKFRIGAKEIKKYGDEWEEAEECIK